MPTVPDPDLVPFDPPDHPTIRAAFRNIIESYPRALYDEQGLVRYRTRFLDSVLVSGPELIHDILVARAHLFRRDDVARQLLTPMLGPTSLFMAEGADWKWQRRAERHASDRLMSPRLWHKPRARRLSTRCSAVPVPSMCKGSHAP